MKTRTRMFRKTRGQGMTEYIIIVALIAIAAIGVVTLFGNNIRGLFNASNDALAGQQNSNSNNQSSTAAGHRTQKRLNNFAKSNY